MNTVRSPGVYALYARLEREAASGGGACLRRSLPSPGWKRSKASVRYEAPGSMLTFYFQPVQTIESLLFRDSTIQT